MKTFAYLLNVLIFISIIANQSVAQTNWAIVEETSLIGTISGTISNGYIFETLNSNYYIVNDYNIQIIVTVMPDVEIYKKGDNYKLIIEDFDDPVICKKLNNVIKTNINGDFEGWDGETIFKMSNGQIWQQASYDYTYHYAYRPEVIIYEFNKQLYMKVEGMDESIRVIRL